MKRSFALVLILIAVVSGIFIWDGIKPTDKRLSYQFTSGRQSIYRLAYESTASTRLDELLQGGSHSGGSAPGHVKVIIRGSWKVVVISASDRLARLACRLDSPTVKMTIDGQRDEKSAKEMLAGFEHNVYLEVTGQGTITQIRFPPAVSPTANRAV